MSQLETFKKAVIEGGCAIGIGNRAQLESLVNGALFESSATRCEKWLDAHDVAILTAWRTFYRDITPGTDESIKQFFESNKKMFVIETDASGNGTMRPVSPNEDVGDKETTYAAPVSMEMNRKYNSQLRQYLRALGFGITKVYGTYAEGLGGKFGMEESTFVVNLQDDPKFFEKIRFLGEKYNQDSVLESPRGTHSAYFHGTNDASWPGYGNDVPVGDFEKNIEPTYMTIVGSSTFAFISPEDKERYNKVKDALTKTGDLDRLRKTNVELDENRKSSTDPTPVITPSRSFMDRKAIRYHETERAMEDARKRRIATAGEKWAESYGPEMESVTWYGLACLNESVGGLVQGWQVQNPEERRTLDRMRSSFGIASKLPTL